MNSLNFVANALLLYIGIYESTEEKNSQISKKARKSKLGPHCHSLRNNLNQVCSDGMASCGFSMVTVGVFDFNVTVGTGAAVAAIADAFLLFLAEKSRSLAVLLRAPPSKIERQKLLDLP